MEGQYSRELRQSRADPDAGLDQDRPAADRPQRRQLGGLPAGRGRRACLDQALRYAPQELAHFFVFLCFDKASYSVGSTYFVDGGILKTL
jgi:NAD(P)-dependent dehydrogenase (short-subunit alcohol dehydrogenase family)